MLNLKRFVASLRCPWCPLIDKPTHFPIGCDFLDFTQQLADACSGDTDKFCIEAGESLPATIDALGTVLSILYRLACCFYGCQGGDHQVEWLAGKLVNQAVSAHRLVRAGQYDEALMVIRGLGEIVNLVWLFNHDQSELAAWKLADKKLRLNRFGPSAVRGRLKKSIAIGAPIDDQRYSALCEIATHPTPGTAPGHYSGTGRPVLGAIVQEVGIFVCVNELGYAIAMAAVPISTLLNSSREIREELKEVSIHLLRTIGSFTILNYEEGLREALRRNSQES